MIGRLLCRLGLHKSNYTGCDYKDTNLVCAKDGDDWPCQTKQEQRKTNP